VKYNAPFGNTDEDAVYTNGNPETGTMGSIPPAASIEYPQREIVHLISKTGMVPDNGDLFQLASGVQSGKLNYYVDFGIPNVYLINADPPITAYKAGQHWNVEIINPNTGSATLSINNLPPRELVTRDGVALKGGELAAGEVVMLVDDGDHLQLQGTGSIGAIMTAPKNYYCDAFLGNDTLYDGTSATVIAGTSHGPFRTVQRAITAAQSWNMNGYYIMVYCADGTYPPFSCGALNGSGGVQITGNLANPGNVVISATAGEAIFVSAPGWNICGFKVQSSGRGVAPHMGNGVRLFGGAILGVWNMDFGPCYDSHISVQSTSTLILAGPQNGIPDAFLRVSGNAPQHMMSFQNGFIHLGGQILSILAPLSIGYWAISMENSVIDASYAPTITGYANVTGKKYAAYMNGVINTGQGKNYFPGTVVGEESTGGQCG
jgi:hypothetical protein